MNAFEKLMRFSDFNSAYAEEYDEVKPSFVQVDVDVLIDENIISEENDTLLDDGRFDDDESNESIDPPVMNFFNLQKKNIFESIDFHFVFSFRHERKNITKRRRRIQHR